LAALAVVAVGTVVVAALAFGLSQINHAPAVPSTSPGSTIRPSVGPVAAGPPTSRTYLDAALDPGTGDPLGPTTDHPQWFANGEWWAALLDPPTGRTRLFRLASDGSSLVETGRVLDERPGAIVDSLWANGHLYLATVVRDRAVGSGVRLARYSPDPTTGFRPDPDFPVRITDRGVRSMALARDSAGRLWLVIVRDGALEVAHSTTNDANWTAPEGVGSGGPIGDDDVAGILAFGPGRLGIAWTSRAMETVHFAWRSDGDPVGSWSPVETVASGSPLLKDPISAAAEPDGSVLVSVAGDVRGSTASPSAARLTVARRDSAWTWNASVAGRVEDRHGPSAVLSGSETGEIDVIATQQSAGSRWILKRSRPDRLEFEAGAGAPLASPAGVDSSDLGGPHLSAGAAPAGADLLVIGFDATLRRYVHSLLAPSAGQPAPSATPGPSSSPEGGSPGPSGGPGGVPVKELPFALVNDTFDVFAPGDVAPAGWEPRTGDAPDRLIVAGAADRGNVLTLRSTAADSVRACKSFTVMADGTLSATVVVRLGGLANADATITSLRLHGTEAALVRFGSGGTFAYYSGATKVRTAVAWKIGTWYRSTVRIDLGRHTYDWQLGVDGSTAPLVRVKGITFRDSAATAVDSICVQTSAGRADLGLSIDRVVVTR
jgi:hypothetical protein